MKSTQNPNLLVMSALVGLIAISSGCQSGFTKPDIGRLAFWKKDDIRLAARQADELAPPSSHFSPEPTDGGSGTKIVGDSRAAVKDDMQARVDNILAKANKKKMADSLKNPIAKQNEKLGKINKQLFGPDGKRGEVSQQAISDIQSKLNALKKSAAKNKAQETVASAAATAKETASDFAANDFQMPAGNINAKAEQMANAGMAKVDALKTKPIAGWNNDFSSMGPKTANEFVASAKNSLADAGESIRQATSIDDNSFAAGSSTKNAASKIGNNAATAAGNMFAATKNMAAKATQSAGDLANSAKQNVQNMAQAALQPASPTQQQHNLLQPMQNTANSITQKAAASINTGVNKIQTTASSIAGAATQNLAAGQQSIANMANYNAPNFQLKQQPTNTTATIKYNGSSNKTSQYPATPYGQFKSQGTNNDFSMNTSPGVKQAGGNANLNTAVQQTSAENEIPAELLLQGNNSFTPGSTKQFQ